VGRLIVSFFTAWRQVQVAYFFDGPFQIESKKVGDLLAKGFVLKNQSAYVGFAFVVLAVAAIRMAAVSTRGNR
jgi:hypothetical protein